MDKPKIPHQTLRTLLFGSNTLSSFAATLEEEKVVQLVEIPGGEFPRQAVRIVLGREDPPEEVICLGKPLLFVDRIIELNSKFFPFQFGSFYRSSLLALTQMFQLEMLVNKAIRDRSVKRCRRVRLPQGLTSNPAIRLNYISLREALAWRFLKANPAVEAIAVCLTDDFAGPSFGYYSVSNGVFTEKWEESSSPGLGHILDLFQRFGNEISLEKSISKKGQALTFKRRFFKIEGLKISPKQSKGVSFPKDCTRGNCEFLKETIKNDLVRLNGTKRAIFVHDSPNFANCSLGLDNIAEAFVSREESLLAACHFNLELKGS